MPEPLTLVCRAPRALRSEAEYLLSLHTNVGGGAVTTPPLDDPKQLLHELAGTPD